MRCHKQAMSPCENASQKSEPQLTFGGVHTDSGTTATRVFASTETFASHNIRHTLAYDKLRVLIEFDAAGFVVTRRFRHDGGKDVDG